MRNLVPVLVMLLAACQPITVQHKDAGVVPVAVRVDDTAYWLEEWYRVIDLPDEQIKRIVDLREKEFADSPGPRSRLRLALLLAAGPASVRDQGRAANLLNNMDKVHVSESERSLAALLTQRINEQSWSSDKIKELRAVLEESRAKVEELERQLHEMTNIEQSIQDRDQLPEVKE